MLDQLPIFIWKPLLLLIYSNHRNSNTDATSIIPIISSLRLTCKYIKDTILTPATCHYVLSHYQPPTDIIVAVPKTPGFISFRFDIATNHHEPILRDTLGRLTPLQWVRALTFDLKMNMLDALMSQSYKYPEFGWTIHVSADQYWEWCDFYSS